MSKKSLEKFYNDLIPPIWEELYFYISDQNLPANLFDKYEHLEIHKIFNKIFVVDWKLGPILYKKERSIATLLLKTSLLEKNIFKLLKRKNNTQPYEFNFILEKYFAQVEIIFLITIWTNENLSFQTKLQQDDKTSTIFQIQFSTFKTHFEKLIKHFYPNKEELPSSNFNILDTIETHFPDLFERYNRNDSIAIAKPKDGLKNSELNNKGKKIIAVASKEDKKKLIITEKQADEFILESVFYINKNKQV